MSQPQTVASLEQRIKAAHDCADKLFDSAREAEKNAKDYRKLAGTLQKELIELYKRNGGNPQ